MQCVNNVTFCNGTKCNRTLSKGIPAFCVMRSEK